MDRAFKGVWIPAEIWLNEELSIMEKLFLVEISSLDGEGGCYAGNNHFKDFFRLSKTRCSGIINSLKDKGYINIKMFYKLDKKTVEKRIIRVNENKLTQESHYKQWSKGMQEIQQFEDKQELQDIADIKEYQHQLEMQTELADLGIEEVEGITGEGFIKKVSGEGESICTEKVKEKSENKHSYEASDDTRNENNDKYSEESSSKPSGRPVYRDVIEYLNKLCKSKYNYKSPKNQKLINARVKEGYSFEDFQNVINRKYEEWTDSDMKKYLRPETLFGTKFERYHNEVEMNLKSGFVSFRNNNLNLNGKGGQAYGKQLKNDGNYRENKENSRQREQSKLLQGCNKTSRYLSEEERQWAERELF